MKGGGREKEGDLPRVKGEESRCGTTFPHFLRFASKYFFAIDIALSWYPI